MDGWCENVPCYSWDDFVNKVHKLPQNKFFYRGQSDDKQPLRSSFDRAVDASQSLARGPAFDVAQRPGDWFFLMSAPSR